MQFPIWTPAALSSEKRGFAGWRLVEAQHHVSTMKLVDTIDEQDILERVIEATKPPVPPDCQHLGFLLATPFRYGAVYPNGSRFRRAGQTEGVFYASENIATAMAEMAFYRLLFFAESPQTAWPTAIAEYTAFRVELKTGKALDLTATPFAASEHIWCDRTNYGPCQDFAAAARQAGVELIRYRSVRDPGKGANLAVLRCQAFAAPKPLEWQTWRMQLSASGVQALCEMPRIPLGFDRNAFADDPRLAGFNWDRAL